MEAGFFIFSNMVAIVHKGHPAQVRDQREWCKKAPPRWRWKQVGHTSTVIHLHNTQTMWSAELGKHLVFCSTPTPWRGAKKQHLFLKPPSLARSAQDFYTPLSSQRGLRILPVHAAGLVALGSGQCCSPEHEASGSSWKDPQRFPSSALERCEKTAHACLACQMVLGSGQRGSPEHKASGRSQERPWLFHSSPFWERCKETILLHT